LANPVSSSNKTVVAGKPGKAQFGFGTATTLMAVAGPCGEYYRERC
jgi:hypothetical protein